MRLVSPIAMALRTVAALSAAPQGGAQPRDERAWQAAASAVWEQVIAAKGGRERLRSIRNFVVLSREEFSRSPRPDVATYEQIEWLFVLPDKLWEFSDHRPGLMGAGGLFVDKSRGISWGSNGYPARNAYADMVRRLADAQYLYLMETSEVRPQPLSARNDRYQRAAVDVVETRVGDERVEFWIDRSKHLPIRIVASWILSTGRPWQVVRRLTDYQSVDGIQMAMKVRTGDDETDKVTTSYHFNVDYDDSIFNPQSLRFETHGWMKK